MRPSTEDYSNDHLQWQESVRIYLYVYEYRETSYKKFKQILILC